MTDHQPPPLGELRRTGASPAPVADDLARRGFAVGRVDAHDKRALLTQVGSALGFPAYYGRNLDALWDCLTDLTVPTALVWSGWQDLAVNHPDDWAAVLRVLSDRVRIAPAFTVVLAGSAEAGSAHL